jgi:peptidoglycan/xylan/chitin deacetylase (PgdA/CDA1 family)/disulfide bond formation protein DsbB
MQIANLQEDKPRNNFYPGLGKALVAISLVLILISIGLGAYFILTAHKTQPAPPITRSKIMAPEVMPAAEMAQTQVTAIGKQFMDAFLQQHYTEMWSMLQPQVRAVWPGENAYVTYWQSRFAGYKLQGFTEGSVSKLSFWVDPETMIQYQNVYSLPISLQIQSLVPAVQRAQLATQFQNPSQLFQNQPLIVQSSSTTSGDQTQWQILRGGPADLEAPILPPVTPHYRTVGVPILMYHHIADVYPTTNVLDRSLTVTPPLFTEQLDYLKKMGYHTITLNQLMDALYYGGPLPQKPIILTFDDGYDDAYNYAYPILKAHGYSGMFYIITGKVGWRGQASWTQLKQMLANGMQMGSHTIHHVDMGDTYLESPALAQQEAQIAQITLQNNLGIPIQHFCYPNGGPFKGTNRLLQQEVVALLAKNGYVSATTDPGPTGYLQSSLAPLALLRIRVDGRETFPVFVASLPAV